MAPVQYPYTAGKSHHTRTGGLWAALWRSRKCTFYAYFYQRCFSEYTFYYKIHDKMQRITKNGHPSHRKSIKPDRSAKYGSRFDSIKSQKVRPVHRRCLKSLWNPDRYGTLFYYVSQCRYLFHLRHAVAGYLRRTSQRKSEKHLCCHRIYSPVWPDDWYFVYGNLFAFWAAFRCSVFP